MATTTFSIGPLSSPRTISAAHLTRLEAACTKRLQDGGIPSPTDQQRVDYCMDVLKAALVTLTRQVEAEAAAATVTSITIT